MDNKMKMELEDQSLWDKTKRWCKKHKKGIIIVGGTVIGIYIFKKGIDVGRARWITDTNCRVDEYSNIFSNPKFVGPDVVSENLIRAVDEDIFTDLAISIEDSVLSKAIDHEVIEKAYNLGDVIKKVRITVDNV